MSGLAAGFLQRLETFKARNGVEVEFSEGCPSHRLCSSYMIYRLRPSIVHMMDGFMSIFPWCVLQGIAMPKDPESLATQLSKLTWWLMLLENDNLESFQKDTSMMILTCPLSTHSRRLVLPRTMKQGLFA